jgi:hypothetical protein
MKKIDLASAVMALLLIFLASQTMERRVTAQDGGMGIEGDALTCIGMSCCGSAACQGPGTPNGCGASCAGGGTITCTAKKADGTCP